jgi:predicted DCC family thiol-disulfide oxidoreductase YuxK
MKLIRETFYGLFHNKVDALGLAVFRIVYTLILFAEISQLFRFRHLIFDHTPFGYKGEVDMTMLFLLWFVILTLMLLGLLTRYALVVNAVLGMIIFGGTSNFEYHVFYAYLGINFLMLFMPVSRVLSLDNLIEKIKYTHIGSPYKVDRKVLEINYLAPVFMGIGLVYFDSIFHKLSSPMWTGGLGMWMPSSLPMIVWSDTSWILNQEYLVKFLGYLVVVFEAVFIFTFWFKRFRLPYFFLGVFFHLGILIAYPIPWFALTAVGLYLLLVPPTFWVKLANLIKSKTPSYYFYYDAECPLCNKVIVAIRHFDIFNKIECRTVQGYASADEALKGISEDELLISIHGVSASGKVYKGYHAYVALMMHMIYTAPLALLLRVPGISHIGQRVYRYVAGNRLTERCTVENCSIPVLQRPVSETEDLLIAGWNKIGLTRSFWKWTLIISSFLQLILISNSPWIREVIDNKSLSSQWREVTTPFIRPFCKLFGITAHPVFMYNSHFSGYNHIFKFVCNENGKRVPLLDDNGMVTNSYANGALWVNYTFRTSSPQLVKKVFESGMHRYLAHFQEENGLAEGTYTIYVKEIETTDHWQHDFLRRQMEKPWAPAGKCTVTSKGYEFEWDAQMTETFAHDTR